MSFAFVVKEKSLKGISAVPVGDHWKPESRDRKIVGRRGQAIYQSGGEGIVRDVGYLCHPKNVIHGILSSYTLGDSCGIRGFIKKREEIASWATGFMEVCYFGFVDPSDVERYFKH